MSDFFKKYRGQIRESCILKQANMLWKHQGSFSFCLQSQSLTGPCSSATCANPASSIRSLSVGRRLRVPDGLSSHLRTLFFVCFLIYLAVQGLTCGMWNLVAWLWIKLWPPALGAWSLSHWTTREVSKNILLPLDWRASSCPAMK